MYPRHGESKDLVAALGETTSWAFIHRLRDKMLVDPTGRRILKEQPVIGASFFDNAGVALLPSSTFGGAYYHSFMQQHNLTPEHRTPTHFIDDSELAYVMTRYRQVHDFWHTLTGLPPTIEGEVALKAFEWAQTGLPMTGLSALLGPLRLSLTEQARYWRVYVPWAIRYGRQATFLLNVYYEEELYRSLDELRSRLRLVPAPMIEHANPAQ